MCSVCKRAIAVTGLVLAGLCCGGAPPPAATPGPPPDSRPVLRVCADPNNLPFSNERREGFENELASLVADDFGGGVAYTWWPQRRGSTRITLNAGVCDVIMGVPEDYDLALTTKPYYQSTYVFVTRAARHLHLSRFDDPRLRDLIIGIHVIGDDYANVPPGDALASRGIVHNIRGYSLLGDYGRPNPPARLIEAVAAGDVDAALAWGPLAGFFAGQVRESLVVTPAEPVLDVPMRFSISMAVRRDNHDLRERLNELLERRRADIDAVLERFHVPRVDRAMVAAR